MSRISVVVPNYNRESIIIDTINNLLAQTHPPHEIIVVDDGSTDKSVEAIRVFGDKIKLIQQSNQGPGAARNAGLAIATGDFVQFQDSDDLLSLNKIEAQAELLEKDDADIVFSPWAHVYIHDQQAAFQTCVLQQALPSRHVELFACLMRGWFTILQSLLFRRSFLNTVGSYKTDLRYGEDMEYFFRILCCSPRVTFAADALTLYRVDAPNKLSNNDGSTKDQRDIDWAKCLQSISEECDLRTLKIDSITRWIFLSRVRKHLRYLGQNPNTPVQLIESLTGETKELPEICLSLTEIGLRITEKIRLLSSGYRWMSGCRAASATPQQIKLIRDLGFEVMDKEL